MIKCPKCGSTHYNTYRHIGAEIWCVDCNFTIRDEGATELNEYKAKGNTDCLSCKFENGCSLKRERGYKPCPQYVREKESKY